MTLLEAFTWYHQSAFKWKGERLVMYIDPWGLGGDLPPADLILITHAHGDHYSTDDLARIKAPKTVFVAPADVARGEDRRNAGTREQDGKIYTSGGRVLNVTARGTTLSQALDRAYAAAEVIKFEGKDYRKDIGKKGLAKER